MRISFPGTGSTSFHPGFVPIFAVLLAGSWLAAEDISISGQVNQGQCATWSWSERGKIPIFDPLASPDSETSDHDLQALDERIRNTVEEAMAKRGWKEAPTGACQVSYSLIQELELDIARYDAGGAVPGNLANSSGGLGAAKPDSYLRKKGTFTLDISTGNPGVRLWRATLSASLGQGKGAEKNSLKLVREVAKSVPKP